MSKKLIVASHRRSGTHLAIDAIVNNFEIFKNNPEISTLTIDHLASHLRGSDFAVDKFRNLIESNTCVLKTHSHGNMNDFFNASGEIAELVSGLFGEAKIVYVARDGRDVLTSLYHYQKKIDKKIRNTSFSQYIRMENNFDNETYTGKKNRIEFWSFHVNSWLIKKNIMLISFDELTNNYSGVLKKVSEFVGEPLGQEIIDVRKISKNLLKTAFQKLNKKYRNQFTSVKDSSVSFRKGVSGDWREHFFDEDLEFFMERAGAINEKLGHK
jgi:hypothetical protein